MRVALLAFSEQEAALDEFLGEDPVPAGFADGWRVRLEPVRHVHGFHEFTDLPHGEPTRADEPAAVLTRGRAMLRLFNAKVRLAWALQRRS